MANFIFNLMYRLFFLLYFIFFSNILISQNLNSNGDYKPGELIIKFKDDIDLKINYKVILESKTVRKTFKVIRE